MYAIYRIEPEYFYAIMHKYTTFMHKQTGVMYKQKWLIYAVCSTFLYILTKRKMYKIDYVVHKWYSIRAQGGAHRGLCSSEQVNIKGKRLADNRPQGIEAVTEGLSPCRRA